MTDPTNMDRTIDDIYNKTPQSLITEIIVCDDKRTGYTRDGVNVLPTDSIGRSAAWNAAAACASSEQLVFLRQATKVCTGWLQSLLSMLADNQESIISPIVHTLNVGTWTLEENRWRRFGWRWNLALYDRPYAGKPDSPSVSSYCLVVARSWLTELGWFDEGMPLVGSTEAIELSLRCWLFGGSVLVDDNAQIGCLLDPTVDNINGLARIVEAWLPAYASYFYDYYGLKSTDVNVGKLDNLARLQERQTVTIESFLSSQLPELFGVYRLRQRASGKSIAIVGTGHSLDMINPAWITRHDIVIGIDYAAALFACDYAVTMSADVVVQLRTKYRDERLILPFLLENRMAGQHTAAGLIAPGCVQFELSKPNSMSDTLFPPFANYDNSLHAAVHLALFMNPISITLFGVDNKIIAGRSHTTRVEYYNDGRLWADSESSRRRFAGYEAGLDRLGKLAAIQQIPLLRVGHA